MKRIVALGLAVLLLLQLMPVYVLAADPESAHGPKTPYYVAIGDSITSGYGLSSDTELELLHLDVAGNVHGSPEASYPRLVANGLKAALTGDPEAKAKNEEFANLGIPALRMSDIAYIITGKQIDGTNLDSLWLLAKALGKSENAVAQELHDIFVKELGKADIVTLNVGANDMLVNMMSDCLQDDNPLIMLFGVIGMLGAIEVNLDNIGDLAGLVSVLPIGKEASVPAEKADNDIAGMLKELLASITMDDVKEFLTYIQTDELGKRMTEYVSDVEDYYDDVYDAVKSLCKKKDVSISIVGCLNPYGNTVTYKGQRYFGAEAAVALLREIARMAVSTVLLGDKLTDYNFHLDSALASVRKTSDLMAEETDAVANEKSLLDMFGLSEIFLEGIEYTLMYNFLGVPAQVGINNLNWYGEELAEEKDVPFIYTCDRVPRYKPGMGVHPNAEGHQAIADVILDTLVVDITYDDNVGYYYDADNHTYVKAADYILTGDKARIKDNPTKGYLGQKIKLHVPMDKDVQYVVVNNDRVWTSPVAALTAHPAPVKPGVEPKDYDVDIVLDDPDTFIYAHCKSNSALTEETADALTVIGDSIGAGVSTENNLTFSFNPDTSYVDCYPTYTAKTLDCELNNLSKPAMATAEMAAIFGRDDWKSVYKNVSVVGTYNGRDIRDIYNQDLADTNLLVYHLGSNDFLFSAGISINTALGMDTTDQDFPKIVQVLAAVSEKRYSDLTIPQILEVLKMMGGTKLSDLTIDKLDENLDREIMRRVMTEATEIYTHNQARLFAEMDKRTADSVGKYALGLYSPLPENINISVHEDLGFLTFNLECPIGKLTNDYMGVADQYLQDLTKAYGWTYVDISDIETAASSFDPHPTVDGHKDIATRLVSAITGDDDPDMVFPIQASILTKSFLDFSSLYATVGQMVTISTAAMKGMVNGIVKVFDQFGNEIKLIDLGNGLLQFKMPDCWVYVEVVIDPIECSKDFNCPVKLFNDVDPTLWYHDGIHYCVANGLLAGVGGKTFAPDMELTRAMAVAILYRMEGEPALIAGNRFKDVPAGAWYERAVRWASGKGIVFGYGNGNFGPEDPVTREELASIVYNYALHKKADIFLKANYQMNYTDKSSISAWAYIPMTWCSMKGIIVGKQDGSIVDPKGTATRAEAASIIRRLCITLGK